MCNGQATGVADLTRDLREIKRETPVGKAVRVVLHVVNGRWHVHHGVPGWWRRPSFWGWCGHGVLSRRTDTDVRVLARHLLAEAREDASLYPGDGRTPVPDPLKDLFHGPAVPEPRRDSLHPEGF
jgi:hypothetical protein